MAKEFIASAKRSEERGDEIDEPIEFDLTTIFLDKRIEKDEDDNDVEVEVERRVTDTFVARNPTDTQLALFSAAFADDAKEMNVVASTIQFLRDVMEPRSFRKLLDKLHDRKDPTEIETLQEIIEYVFEEASDRPTSPPSDSTPSPRPGGRTSTASSRAKASTRSSSRRAGS